MSYCDDIKDSLTPEEIIDIVTNILGAHTYREQEDFIIFPTICHHIDSGDARLKLYYYKENKLFHCYTDCGDSFDIFGLFRRYYKLRNMEYDFYHDILFKIVDKDSVVFENNNYSYKPLRDRYRKRNRDIKLPTYPKNILNIYPKLYPEEWTYENISDDTMEYFGIRFSPLDNKIIIPHYDIDGNLIGVRARALNDYDIANFGKYMPIKIENQWYAHHLSLNLYGINLNKDAISRNKRVILFEGEKSVLLYNEFYGKENNNSLAVCGSNFNKLQLSLLLKNFYLNEIIIAFDKEYSSYPTKESEEYFNKMMKICLKYKNYCNFSFIYDTKNLLKEKDSPVDKGKSTFEKLLKERIRIE